MANLTITVDDEALKAARIKALAQGTSVNALLGDYLSAYAGVHNRHKEATRRILELADRCRSRRGDARWTRDELHERGC